MSALLLPTALFTLTAWKTSKHSVFPLLLFLIFLGGILKITLDKHPPELRALDAVLALPQPVLIDGVVVDPPKTQGDRIRLVVDVHQVRGGGRSIALSTSVLTSLESKGAGTGVIDSLTYGRKIQFVGMVTYPGAARNPGEFDLRHYLQLHGIYARAFIEDVGTLVVGEETGNRLFREVVYPLRGAISQHLDLFVGGEEAKFLKGLTIGDRSEISSEVKDAFVNAGVMHILAVSGLHVGLITIMFVVVLSMLRLPETVRIVLVCALLIIYIFLTGSSPSVVRAVIMAVVVFGAKLFDRKVDVLNSLAVAALVILFWDARQLSLPGFQLSFAAVLSIVLLYPVFYSWFQKLSGRLRDQQFVDGIIRLFCLSLAAGLGTLPFTALYFGKIPVVGFLANIPVVPLSGVVLAAAMTAVVFSFMWDAAAILYGLAAKVLTFGLLESVAFFGNLPFSYVDAYFSTWEIILFYAGITVVVTIGRWSVKRLIIVLLVFFNCLLYASLFGFIGTPAVLRTTFLDVGQGDAVFVEFPNGKNMLIDAGPRGLHTDAGRRVVVPFLKNKNIDYIDAVVVSHPHNDHGGGVPSLLREIRVGRVLDAGSKTQSSLLREYHHLVDSLNVPYRRIIAGDTIDCGRDVRLYVVHPSGRFIPHDTSGRNINNESVVMKLAYGNTSMLFAGDAEEEAEEIVVRRYNGFLRSDVLKVGHHGSGTSSTERFLAATSPAVAVISVGRNNKFRHPSQIVLGRLREKNVRVYRTDEQNAVILMSDGLEWKEESWR